MLKILLISAFCLLSLVSNAQFIPGAYILMENPQKVYTGDLKYYESTLTVRGTNGKKIKFKPNEVYYARTSSNQRYISTSGFVALSHFGTEAKGNTLVELIDSGRFCLMRYDYSVLSGSGGGTSHFLYVVKEAGGLNAVSLTNYVWTNKGKKFYDSLIPYAASRPDLQDLLVNHQISQEDVPAFFHALNSGQPFPLTESMKRTPKPKKEKELDFESPFKD